jgi:hypothetical protein
MQNSQVLLGVNLPKNGINLPKKGLLDKDFVYIPACKTDIMERFKALGFVPPSTLQPKKEG